MVEPTLVVMAAGIGTRFGGLKQVAPVGPNGETTIAYALYDALLAGFGKFVFVVTEEIKPAFRERIGKHVEARAETVYVLQQLDCLPQGCTVPQGRTKPWGTAHAVLCCKEAVGTPFAAINADDFYGRTTFRAIADYLRNAHAGAGEYDYCMAGFILKNTLSHSGHVARGICAVSAEGLLENVVERRRIRPFGDSVRYAVDDEQWVEISPDSIVSMNMWGFTPSLFGELEERFVRFLEERGADTEAEFFIPEVVAELVKEKRARVKVLPTDETWAGVTYRADVPEFRKAVRGMIDRGVYPERLWG